MPLALLMAVAVHLAALFGPEIELPGLEESTQQPLKAELRTLPVLGPAEPTQPVKLPVKKSPRPKPASVTTAAALPVASSIAPSEPEAQREDAAESLVQAIPVAAPVKPRLPAEGMIRYRVYKGSMGMEIGQAEQRWQFAEDGHYVLHSVMETTGLAAWLRRTRIEQSSQGRLTPSGLQPTSFSVKRNDREDLELAEFDWSTATVQLSRKPAALPVAPGSQDALSLNFQLAYLPHLAAGSQLGVVTGRKYGHYAVDALGEEEIEVPAGRFRTLHLRVQTENTTEIWIALEHQDLPVKIRFTDKKGERFEQLASEIGMP